MRRLALGAVAGFVWAAGTVVPWLSPAVQRHLAAEPVMAFALASGAAWLYGGVYVAVFALVYPWLPAPRWLTAPAAWLVGEWVRAHAFGGAPWALLGHALHACLPLAQLAEWTGVSGLSALALLPAAALVESGRQRRIGAAVAGLALAAAALLGVGRIADAPPAGGETVLRVVGGLHAAPDPLVAYVAASASAPAADLTIWPETAITDYLQDERAATDLVAALARGRGWLLVGGPRHTGSGATRRYFNSALLLAPDGSVAATYDKTRLVPFAERSPWPFRSLVERPFSAGSGFEQPLRAGPLRVGPLVCWEAVFPELARRHVLAGAHVLVNLTSDRDLGAGATQATAFSRFRAIETRRWLVRASGFGPTTLIDPFGRLHAGDVLALDVGASPPPTFHTRHGEVLPGLALAGLLVAAGMRTIRRTLVRTRRRG